MDTDLDYDRDRIVGDIGSSQARWTGDAGELSFPGTIDGHRRGDVTGQEHPILQAMNLN